MYINYVSDLLNNSFQSVEVVLTPNYVSEEIVFGAIYKASTEQYHVGIFTKTQIEDNSCWTIITSGRSDYKRTKNNYKTFVPLEVISYKVAFNKKYENHNKSSIFNINLVKILATNSDMFLTDIVFITLRDFIENYQICEKYSND